MGRTPTRERERRVRVRPNSLRPCDSHDNALAEAFHSQAAAPVLPGSGRGRRPGPGPVGNAERGGRGRRPYVAHAAHDPSHGDPLVGSSRRPRGDRSCPAQPCPARGRDARGQRPGRGHATAPGPWERCRSPGPTGVRTVCARRCGGPGVARSARPPSCATTPASGCWRRSVVGRSPRTASHGSSCVWVTCRVGRGPEREPSRCGRTRTHTRRSPRARQRQTLAGLRSRPARRRARAPGEFAHGGPQGDRCSTALRGPLCRKCGPAACAGGQGGAGRTRDPVVGDGL